mgnify:CR=1 FL=1
MKATGIVRRIDELGRVVIPKEIRRTQRIRRGDPLEIFTTGDGEVIFKKYSPMGELSGVTAQYVDVLSKCFALTAFVSDRDRILAASGAGRRDLADRSVSQPLEKLKLEGEPGVFLCNPPYGERMGERDEIETLYRQLGRVFPALYPWQVYILTSHPRFERLYGQPADRVRRLYNGMIPCYLYEYFKPVAARTPKSATPPRG